MRSKQPAGVAIVLAVVSVILLGLGIYQLDQERTLVEITAFGPELGEVPTAPPSSSSPESPPLPGTGPKPPTSPIPLGEVPERLEIPAIGVDARVRPVGLGAHRSVEIPPDIGVIGWYRYSARAGSGAGAVVLVGHRDGRVAGKGAFYDLGALNEGDRVTVTGDGGARIRYRVVARRLLLKADFSSRAEDVFASGGAPRLRLISCGGLYVPESGGYQANVIVTAEQVLGQDAI